MKRFGAMVVTLLIGGGVCLGVRERAAHRLDACMRATVWAPNSYCEHERFELEERQDFGTLGACMLLPIGAIAGLVMVTRGRRIRLRPLRSHDADRWDRLARQRRG